MELRTFVNTRIENVSFGFYKSEEILKLSCCEITTNRVTDELNIPIRGGLYDPRMGPIDPMSTCETCSLNHTQCPGHFGHIRLCVPIYNPFAFKMLFKLMKCTCLFCHRMKISPIRLKIIMAKLLLLDKGYFSEMEMLDKLSYNMHKHQKAQERQELSKKRKQQKLGKKKNQEIEMEENEDEFDSDALFDSDNEKKQAKKSDIKEFLVEDESTQKGNKKSKKTSEKNKETTEETVERMIENILEKAGVIKKQTSEREERNAKKNKEAQQSEMKSSWEREKTVYGEKNRREIIKKLLDEIGKLRRCENCGGVAFDYRADKQTKIFLKPLTPRQRKELKEHNRAMRNVLGTARGKKRKEQDQDGSETEKAGIKPWSKAKFLSTIEVERHIKLLWENEKTSMDILFGSLSQNSQNIDSQKTQDNFRVQRESTAEMFFLNVLPVTPPRFRPPNFLGETFADHVQTRFFAKVMEWNMRIMVLSKQMETPKKSEQDQEKKDDETTVVDRRFGGVIGAWNMLQYNVNCLYDAAFSRDFHPTPGIRQVMEKKEGLFRRNMMGKRVNYAARSVISPDPLIRTNEIGVPLRFAKKLSFPEPVTQHNVKRLRQAVVNGPDRYPGANYLLDERGSIFNLQYLTRPQRVALSKKLLTQPRRTPAHSNPANNTTPDPFADLLASKKVGRHLLAGDVLLVNRQPTLHKPSIMAHRAKILYGQNTIRLHYANCNSYNADFDGDEMNLHFPQDHISRAEAYEIAGAERQYTSGTDGRPLRGLIQDNIVTGILLTQKNTFFTRPQAMQLLYSAFGDGSEIRGVRQSFFSPYSNEDINDPRSVEQTRFHLGIPAIIKPKPLWTGKQIISFLLAHLTCGKHPISIVSNTKVPVSVWGGSAAKEEGTVIVVENELLTGVLDRAQFGASNFGLVHSVFELYGPSFADTLLSALGRLFTYYLQIHGFTCGMDDMLMNKNAEKIRRELFVSADDEAERVTQEFVDEAPLRSESNPNPKNKNQDENENENDENLLENENEDEDEDNLLKSIHRAQIRSKLRHKIAADPEQSGGKLDSLMKSALSKITTKIIEESIPVGQVKRFPQNFLSLMTSSGAKGSVVNFSQISCLLGQQELEGRRVPLMTSGKSLPCFAPFDLTARAGGFVRNRFLTGISPPEYFFHSMAGREGLVDTAVKTSRSGYLQRCLIKHLEGLRVHYDSTVRDSDGSIIQFLYGEDGIDVSKSKFLDQFIFVLRNCRALIDKYQPKVVARILSTREALSYDRQATQYNSALISQTISRLSKIAKNLEKTDENSDENLNENSDENLNENSDENLKHTNEISEKIDNRSIVDKILEQNEDSVFDMNQKISLIQKSAVKQTTQFKNPKTLLEKFAKSHPDFAHLLPQDIFSSYTGLAKLLPFIDPVISILDPSRNLGAISDKLSYQIQKYIESNPDNLLSSPQKISYSTNQAPDQTDKPTAAQFRSLMFLKYFYSLVQPGETVGIIAAQSIGEPSTQMSLAYDEGVILRFGKSISTLPIGNFIDSLLSQFSKFARKIHNSSDSLVLDIPSSLNLLVPGICRNESVDWLPVSQISRHPPNGILINIITKSGRHVCATPSHSFLTRSNNNIIPIRGSDLRTGHFLPVASNLPLSNSCSEKFLYLNHPLPSKIHLSSFFASVCAAYLFSGSVDNLDTHPSSISFSNIPSLDIANLLLSEFLSFARSSAFSVYSHSIDTSLSTFKLTLHIQSEYCLLFHHLFPQSQQSFPHFLYSAHDPFIESFLSMFLILSQKNPNSKKQTIYQQLRSNSINHKKYTILERTTTYSIALLLSRLQIFSTFHYSKSKKTYTLKIPNIAQFKQQPQNTFQDLIPGIDGLVHEIYAHLSDSFPSLPQPKSLPKKTIPRSLLQKHFNFIQKIIANDPNIKLKLSSQMKTLENAINSKIIWDEIVEITPIIPKTKYVYDFSVKTSQSFTTSSGIIVHNTLNSVDWQEEIILKNEQTNLITTTKMGEFIDSLISKTAPNSPSIERFPNDTTLINIDKSSNYSVLSVSKKGKIEWKTLEAVTRHLPINKDGSSTLLKITTRSGRSVIATKAKSFLRQINNKIVPVSGASLSLGDYIPITKRISIPENAQISSLSFSQYISQKSLFYNIFNTSSLSSHPHLDPSIPLNIPLNFELGFFLGIFFIKGSSSKNYPHSLISINIDKKDFPQINHIVHLFTSNFHSILDEFRKRLLSSIDTKTTNLSFLKGNLIQNISNFNYNTSNNIRSNQIQIESSFLILFLQFCFMDLNKPTLPNWFLLSKSSFLKGFLDASINTTSIITQKKDSVSIKTHFRDEKTFSLMIHLLNRFGIVAEIGDQHQLQLSNHWAQKFAFKIGTILQSKSFEMEKIRENEQKQNLDQDMIPGINTKHFKGSHSRFLLKKELKLNQNMMSTKEHKILKRLIHNDIHFDDIVNIEEVEPTHKHVYDLTVSDNRTFANLHGINLYDTFHLAGFGATNLTLGIPRLREVIMTASKKISTPTMILPLKDHLTRDDATQLALLLSNISLSGVISSIQVSESLQLLSGNPERVYHIKLNLRSKRLRKIGKTQESLNSIINIFFLPLLNKIINKEISKYHSSNIIVNKTVSKGDAEFGETDQNKNSNLDNEDDMTEAQRKDKKTEKATYDEADDEQSLTKKNKKQNTTDVAGNQTIRIENENNENQIENQNENNENIENNENQIENDENDENDENQIENIDKTLTKTKTREKSQNTKESTPIEIKQNLVDQELKTCQFAIHVPLNTPKFLISSLIEEASKKTEVHNVKGIQRCYVLKKENKGKDKFYLQTEGVNLTAAHSYSTMIDIEDLECNDIAAILDTYGVEAARESIILEIQKVFKVYSVSVDTRHLSLIADYMTYEGTFRALNRITMNSSVSPFQKMSFETTFKFLLESVLHGDYDDLRTPSSRIVVGRVGANGSGAFDIMNPLNQLKSKSKKFN